MDPFRRIFDEEQFAAVDEPVSPVRELYGSVSGPTNGTRESQEDIKEELLAKAKQIKDSREPVVAVRPSGGINTAVKR